MSACAFIMTWLRVHFFGKIQKWIIAWDHTDSFLPKKQRIRKEINHGFFSAKETKNPKTEFSRATILWQRPLATCIFFFESFPKEMQQRQILRIQIQINPLNPHHEQIHWIHNPFSDFTKETKSPFLDSKSGLGFFPKKYALNIST